MVILLRAAELNLDNCSYNMIFAHPIERTVLLLNGGFLCLAVNSKYMQSVSLQKFLKSKLMMIVIFGFFLEFLPFLGWYYDTI